VVCEVAGLGSVEAVGLGLEVEELEGAVCIRALVSDELVRLLCCFRRHLLPQANLRVVCVANCDPGSVQVGVGVRVLARTRICAGL